MAKATEKTRKLVQMAILIAIMLIMAFTPLGYLKVGMIEISFMTIPVVIGAILLGPAAGATLGGVFGLTSFIKNTVMPTSLSAFVFSPVLAASMVGTSGIVKSAFICFVPRILVGILPYFVYIGVKKALSSRHKILWASVFNILIGVFLFLGARAFLLHLFDKKPLSDIALYAVSALVGWFVFMALEVYTVLKSGAVCAFVYAGVTGAMVNTILVMGGIFVLYKDAYAKALSVDAGAVLGIIGGVISFNGVIEAIVAAIIVAALGMVLNKLKPIRK